MRNSLPSQPLWERIKSIDLREGGAYSHLPLWLLDGWMVHASDENQVGDIIWHTVIIIGTFFFCFPVHIFKQICGRRLVGGVSIDRFPHYSNHIQW